MDLEAHRVVDAMMAKAIEAGGNNIKLRALDDPDLGPLWKEVKNP